MGRYYYGDIDGKFWFGVQASNDADHFGTYGKYNEEHNSMEYLFTEDHMPDVREGIEECEKELGKYKEIIKEYFRAKNGYNDIEMSDDLGVTKKELERLLVVYARLGLGEKIYRCLLDKGQCSFTGEC